MRVGEAMPQSSPRVQAYRGLRASIQSRGGRLFLVVDVFESGRAMGAYQFNDGLFSFFGNRCEAQRSTGGPRRVPERAGGAEISRFEGGPEAVSAIP
jgi:hypothetical protein